MALEQNGNNFKKINMKSSITSNKNHEIKHQEIVFRDNVSKFVKVKEVTVLASFCIL